jgi:hypothetical protein
MRVIKGWAIGRSGQANFAKLHGQRVKDEDATNQQSLGMTKYEFNDFGGLETTHGTRQNAQDAAFGATGHVAGRQRRGQKVAIIGCGRVPVKDGQLSLKGQNGRVNLRNTVNGAYITEQVQRLCKDS